ncbi:hypothetical protein XENOCAPTIV_006720 [Xenoophorus captivus]|uniref:Uncharacterized protein n=1 Tax=Xenoophorus captivus TaxID=1517983 RepID=A0ABV0RHI7_9TELE
MLLFLLGSGLQKLRVYDKKTDKEVTALWEIWFMFRFKLLISVCIPQFVDQLKKGKKKNKVGKWASQTQLSFWRLENDVQIKSCKLEEMYWHHWCFANYSSTTIPQMT